MKILQSKIDGFSFAQKEAERYAHRDANKALWFVVGCVGSVLVIILGQLIDPTPPQAALLGKSPEYVSIFTDVYKRKVKSLRLTYSAIGCLVGTALWTAVIVLLVLETAAIATYDYY